MSEKYTNAVNVKVTESDQQDMIEFMNQWFPGGSQSEMMRMGVKLMMKRVRKDGGFMRIVKELVE